MNVTVSGLTGAGKSTLCTALAETLALKVIAGSRLRAQMTGLDADPAGQSRAFWMRDPRALAADQQRLHDDAQDRAIDAELARRHDHEDGWVFDVWFMPWIATRPSMRIWLDAPLDLRVRRVAAAEGITDVERVRGDVVAKDERSRAYALATYGVDLDTDRRPFSIIVDVAAGAPADALTRVLGAALLVADGRAVKPLSHDDVVWARRSLVRAPAEIVALFRST